MQLFSKRRKLLVLAALTLIGALMLAGAQYLSTWQSPQVVTYNQGVQFYLQGDADSALKAFDQSLDAYRRQSNAGWLERTFLPGPSRELAALANAHKAILMLVKQKPDLAVLAFKESLKLNPGDQYEGLSPADAKRLHEQALTVKYNLELMFKKNPSQAQKEGKGQGKGQGKPGNKPSPGDDPGKMPGKGNRNDI